MFIHVKQGTKNPEAGPLHWCTEMHNVVTGNSRNDQKRVFTHEMVEAPLHGR